MKNTTESTPEKSTEFLRKTYYGNAQSDAAIEAICRKYNLSEKSDAIRLAVQLVAISEPAQLPQPVTKRGRPPMRAR